MNKFGWGALALGVGLSVGTYSLNATVPLKRNVSHGDVPGALRPASIEPSLVALPARSGARSFTGRDTIIVNIDADGGAETVVTRRRTALTSTALRSTGWLFESFSESLDSLEVIEAHTEKVNGAIIPVGPAGILTGNLSLSADIHDFRRREVLFPDLSVGDTAVLTTRKRSKPTIPGVFQLTVNALNDIEQTVTVTAPRAVPLKAITLGEGFSHNTASSEATQTHIFSHPGSPHIRTVNERGFVDTPDRIAKMIISNQEDFAQYGRTVWDAYRRKAEVTPKIRELAGTITEGVSDRRRQVEIIDRWVKQNIRYMLVALGSGAWIPDSAADVLDKRYSDCKGLSVLISALLAAKGIPSEYVLVNSSNSIYELPPVVDGSFNHVLLYVPEFSLYVDGAGSLSGFGVLAPQSYDKPVVRFGAHGATVDRIPAMRPDDHTIAHVTRIQVAADGTVSGQTTELTSGIFANRSRKYIAGLAQNEQAAARELASNDTPGKGRFVAHSLATLADPFAIKGEFVLKAKMQNLSGSEYPIPVGLTVRPRADDLLGARVAVRTRPFVCNAGRQVEDIEITFSEGLPLPLVPADARTDTAWFQYRAQYRLENRTLKVKRTFVSTVASQVCPSHMETAIAPAMKAIANDLAKKITLAPVLASGTNAFLVP